MYLRFLRVDTEGKCKLRPLAGRVVDVVVPKKRYES
jgi:hypothetical protein